MISCPSLLTGKPLLRCVPCSEKSELRQERQELRHRREMLWHPTSVRLARAIPPHFRHARIGRVPENLREALAKRGREQSLLLFGGVGIGKTYAIAAVVRDMIVRTRGGVKVARTTHAGLDQALRASFTRHSHTSELDVLKPLLEADVLWLEDIGSGVTPSEFTQRTLETVIDHRIEQERVTIVTSNLSVAQIENAYGPRVGSRLSTFMVVRLQGKDRRKSR